MVNRKNTLLRPSSPASAAIDYPETLPPSTSSIKLKFSLLPQLLWLAAALFLILSLFDFKRAASDAPSPIPPPSNEGQAIYLVLDQSGSMEGSKIDSLKKVSEQFISSRPGDLLGVVAFARSAQVISPLTLDHTLVLDALKNLKVIKDPEQNGTAIGYAIYKTANLIAATRQFSEGRYKLKGAVMVLVTDGLQDPNSLDNNNPLRNQDIPEAAGFAKEQNIRLYIINIDPKMSLDQYSAHRSQMTKAAESTGGQFYLADTPDVLSYVFAEINKLEKISLPQAPVAPPGKSTAPFFIFLSLCSFVGALFLQTTFFRRLPG